MFTDVISETHTVMVKLVASAATAMPATPPMQNERRLQIERSMIATTLPKCCKITL